MVVTYFQQVSILIVVFVQLEKTFYSIHLNFKNIGQLTAKLAYKITFLASYSVKNLSVPLFHSFLANVS